MKKLLLLAIVVLGISAVSFAQDATTTAASSATIITPLSITKVSGTAGDLMFGNIISNDATGTVVVPAEDNPTALYSGVKPPVGLAGTIQAASFTVSGMNNAHYTITEGDDFEVSETTGQKMTVSDVTASTTSGVLSGSGSQTIYVGATLNVKANQKAGLYTSDAGLTITVAYD